MTINYLLINFTIEKYHNRHLKKVTKTSIILIKMYIVYLHANKGH